MKFLKCLLILALATGCSFSAYAQWGNAELSPIAQDGLDPSIWHSMSHQHVACTDDGQVHFIHQQHSYISNNLLYKVWNPIDGWFDSQILNEELEHWQSIRMVKGKENTIWLTYILDNELFAAKIDEGELTSWQITDGAVELQAGNIAADEDGNAHLAWAMKNAAGNFKIFYATGSDGNYTTEELAFSEPFQDPDEHVQISLVVDDQGFPHISHSGPDMDGKRIFFLSKRIVGGNLVWNYSTIFELDQAVDSDSRLSTSGNYIHMLVRSQATEDGPADLFYLRKTLEANTWLEPVSLYSGSFFMVGDLRTEASGVARFVMTDDTRAVRYYDNSDNGLWTDTLLIDVKPHFELSFDISPEGKAYLATKSHQDIGAFGDFTVVPAGFSSISTERLLLYPNPCSNTIHFNTLSELPEILVYDLSGKLQLRSITNSSQLDVSALKSGYYRLLLRSKDQVRQAAFIKE